MKPNLPELDVADLMPAVIDGFYLIAEGLGLVARYYAPIRNPTAPEQCWEQQRLAIWHFDFALAPPRRNQSREFTLPVLDILVRTWPHSHRLRRALEQRRSR